jgi:hypothetical protein
MTIDSIPFHYADGPHDAEAFLMDPETRDLFIITKRDAVSHLYCITFPYSASNTAVLVTTLPYNGVVSAALSPDGKEVLVKTLQAIYYYSRKEGETIPDCLGHSYRNILYHPEPQGEAIGYATSNTGFYTTSEKAFADSVKIRFYPRR